jgi:hypothetical protein
MEIHRPKASHSWREFFIEIGTITLGILIALALESLIVSARDRHLVENARSDLRSELQGNRRDLAKVIADAGSSATLLRMVLDDAQQWLQTGSVDARSRIEQNATQLGGSVSVLSTAAWEAAGVSQAVVHMSLREAQALTKVYSATRTFNGLEQQVEERWFELSGLPTKLQGVDRSVVESGIGQLKVLLGYQLTVVATGGSLLQEYDDALRALGPG